MGVVSTCAIRLEDRPITSHAPPRPGKNSRWSWNQSRTKAAGKKKPKGNAQAVETCAAQTRLIGDYLSDNLAAVNRQVFERHLNSCPECAAFLATYKKTINLTRSFLQQQRMRAPTGKLTLRLPIADLR